LFGLCLLFVVFLQAIKLNRGSLVVNVERVLVRVGYLGFPLSDWSIDATSVMFLCSMVKYTVFLWSRKRAHFAKEVTSETPPNSHHRTKRAQ
jgi:hypothetical protein